jgi:hypothetical protein
LVCSSALMMEASYSSDTLIKSIRLYGFISEDSSLDVFKEMVFHNMIFLVTSTLNMLI